MSDKPDPKHGGLVPIGRRGLTTRSSALVRRGLEALASQQPRIVRFPLNRSIGRLFVLNWDPHGDDECEDFGEARGDITVPAGKGLGLLVSVGASTDLSPLTGLKPDDIQELSLSGFRLTMLDWYICGNSQCCESWISQALRSATRAWCISKG